MTMIQKYIALFFKGMAMGAADIVPGVSGGTVAFITGIYERLLNALKSFDLELVKMIFAKDVKNAWKKIDGGFLLPLFAGIFVSLFSLAKAINWCLHAYPQLLWSFFFGLIIASIVYIFRKIDTWKVSTVLSLLLGAIIALFITRISPTEIEPNYLTICLLYTSDAADD